jgi:hypothetical protein
MREYGTRQALVANAPYVAMVLVGVATILTGFRASPLAFAGAAAYVAYGLASPIWIMVFVCPHCAHYATMACPCGYGIIAARLVHKGDHDRFAEKFKRHIPVIVPLWIIPVVCGGWVLWHKFSWPLLGLMCLFAVNAYVVLPLASTRHSCRECPQRSSCPWMASDRERREPIA